MEASLVVGLSAQMALRRNMEIIANNLANSSTAGFKREAPLFEELLVPVENADGSGSGEVSFVRDWGVVRDMTAGSLEQTGGTLDVAVDGNGMLVVNTAAGERYTRDGHLKLNEQGKLVTADGDPVMSDGGEIVIPPGEAEIKIAADGTVSTRQGAAGKLRVVSFAANALSKEGKNLYSANVAASPALHARVMQGMIERSNVEPVVEITKMIEVQRAYQHSTETLNATDDIIRRAVQRLGDIKA
jgi:flagellar basal-body rod protein FlgF